jgi:F0F1-type ATP synthase membrane subunit b/b'
MSINQQLIILVGILILLYVLYCLKVPQQEGLKNRVKRRLRRAAKNAKEAARKAKEKAKRAAEKAAEEAKRAAAKAAEEAKRAAAKAAEEAKRAAAKAAEALRIDKAIKSLLKGVIGAQKSVFNVGKSLKG